jgi:hypothetical protein
VAHHAERRKPILRREEFSGKPSCFILRFECVLMGIVTGGAVNEPVGIKEKTRRQDRGESREGIRGGIVIREGKRVVAGKDDTEVGSLAGSDLSRRGDSACRRQHRT